MTLHFVRHLPMDQRYAGVCYGASDVGLSSDPNATDALITRLGSLGIDTVISSDLGRCLSLARQLVGVPLHIDARWRERDFGAWEMKRWDDIHAADATAIDGLSDPAFAPPQGESLLQLGARVRSAIADLPARCLVVSHGGPIAVARTLHANLPLSEAARLIPRPGEIVTLT